MKASGRREGRLTCPTSVLEAGSHPGPSLAHLQRFCRRRAPERSSSRTTLSMLEAGNRGAGKVRREMGLGSPGPGLAWGKETPPWSPSSVLLNSQFSSHVLGVVQLLGRIRQFPLSHHLSTAWAPHIILPSVLTTSWLMDTDMYKLPRVRHPRLPIPAPM